MSGEMKAESDAALEFKNEGNAFFKAGKFVPALLAYSKAIDIAPSAVLYANRAFANLKTENFGSAITDAQLGIAADKTYVKSYYRLGSAYLALGKYKDAMKQFHKVVKLAPKDKDARKKYKICQKAARREAFEAAIAGERERPISETVDAENMIVPSSYKGPHLENGVVTKEFVLAMMEEFKAQRNIHKKYALQILLQARTLLRSLPSLVRPKFGAAAAAAAGGDAKEEEGEESTASADHFNVCGDTHGQFFDVLNIFDTYGLPSPTNPYLFNGDFVDRGSFSMEVVMTFLAWKVVYPDAFHMTRGNHESKNMNKIYGFEGEIQHKFDQTVMDVFSEVFNSLPLAAVINDGIFVVHGGLFKDDGVTLADVAAVDRFREPPDSGLMSDMLWSDPQPFKGRGPSKRGVGQCFGPDITAQFLQHNNLKMIVRSHEVKQEGYLVEHEGKLVTVFSAPNYCDQMGNKGALIRFNLDLDPEYFQFSAVPHPPIKPMAYARGFGGFGL